jgi:hypothetical protein
MVPPDPFIHFARSKPPGISIAVFGTPAVIGFPGSVYDSFVNGLLIPVIVMAMFQFRYRTPDGD